MVRTLMLGLFTLAITTSTWSAERKPLADVAVDAITSETQDTPDNAGDHHVALAWWIPVEFWESILIRDTTTPEAGKKALLNSMTGTSMLAIVQADVSETGEFQFYPKSEVDKKLSIYFANEAGVKKRVSPLQQINPDLQTALSVFKPILGNAMGNMGNNMHFYVLSDVGDDGGRLVDPYEAGEISVSMTKRDATAMSANITLPLDSLYIPRKCSNGKDAHISWDYCPWTGQRLPE